MKIKEVNYTYLPTRLSTEYLLSQKWQSLLMALCRTIEYNIPIIFFLQIWKYSLDSYLLKLFLCIFLSVCVCVFTICCKAHESQKRARDSEDLMLHLIVSLHMGSWNHTLILCKSNKCSYLNCILNWFLPLG